jgi:tRNA A-37 threonylcarbamoyl transferase component Bud32/streptogramin lyase
VASELHLSTGDEIAGYTLESLLGRGGMGEVFRAVDRHLARAVALKVLAPELVDDQASRERILRESQLAASIDHPNVIPVYSAGEADGHVYIAMRLVEGSDLRSVLRRDSRLDPARAIALATQVAAALDAAHARGLVHRDVKPSNVLIDEQQEREHCYLADFGITTRASDRPSVDVSQRLMGTLAYVAPEQVRGDPVDGRADVYSLGCLLYECLTGEVPFVRDSDIALVFAHLEEPPPQPSEHVPELPAELDAVIAKALAKRPDDRYTSCAELVDDARRALALDAPARSRRGLAAALIVVVLAVVAAAIAVTVRSGGDAAPAPSGSVIRIDPASGAVTASYRLSVHPSAVAVGAQVWVADYRQGTLWRIDPRTGATASIPAIGNPRALGILGGRVYVGSDGPSLLGGNVTRYYALTGSRIDSVPVVPCSVAAGDGVAYAAGCPYLQRLSAGPGKLRVVHKQLIALPAPPTAENVRMTLFGLAIGEGAVWAIGDALDRRLFKIEPRSSRVLGAFRLPITPQRIAAGAGSVWITDAIHDVLIQVDPASGRVVRRIATCRGTDGVAVGAGAVWVACAIDGQVLRIDPASGRIVKRIGAGKGLREVVAGPSGVWVTRDAF